MDILYTLNENYVRHLAASLCSLCDNNKNAEEIIFHIMSCGITDESKAKIKALAESFERKVEFYEVGDIRQKLDPEVDTKGFDVSIMTRLFVASYIPKTVERILYLDCDTIVIDDISYFYNTSIDEWLLAAVPEPVITKSRRPLLQMKPEDDYYNSGVILFNLNAWRDGNCEKRVISYFFENMDNIIAGDQDAINGCFKGQIKSVAPKYNYGSYNIYYPYRLLKKLSGAAPYVSEDVYLDSKAHPAIIHYLGEERPWRAGNTHPYTKHYKHYLSLTDWKDVPDEQGWKLYFICFRIFNFFTKPFPGLRFKIIDALIPAFMRHRAKKLKKSK